MGLVIAINVSLISAFLSPKKLLSKNNAVATDQFSGNVTEKPKPLELVKLLLISPNFLKSVLKDVEKEALNLTFDFFTFSFFSGSTFIDELKAFIDKTENAIKIKDNFMVSFFLWAWGLIINRATCMPNYLTQKLKFST